MVAVFADLPIQNFIASLQGVFIMNSLDSWSYFAVVKIPFAFDPLPSSVRAKHPVSSPFSILFFQEFY